MNGREKVISPTMCHSTNISNLRKATRAKIALRSSWSRMSQRNQPEIAASVAFFSRECATPNSGTGYCKKMGMLSVHEKYVKSSV